MLGWLLPYKKGLCRTIEHQNKASFVQIYGFLYGKRCTGAGHSRIARTYIIYK